MNSQAIIKPLKTSIGKNHFEMKILIDGQALFNKNVIIMCKKYIFQINI